MTANFDITSAYLREAGLTKLFDKQSEIETFKKLEESVANVMLELHSVPELNDLVWISPKRLHEDPDFLRSFAGEDVWGNREQRASIIKWAASLHEACSQIDPEIQDPKSDDSLKQALKRKYDLLNDIELGRRLLKAAMAHPAAAKARVTHSRINVERNKIMQANLRLVPYVAKRYNISKASVTIMDLVQEGNIGMMRAIERFDWRRGHKFSTYAIWWIRQSITRFLQEKCDDVRVPVHVKEVHFRVKKETQAYTMLHGHKPEISTLECTKGVTKEMLKALEHIGGPCLSVDSPIRGTEELLLGDTLSNPDDTSQEEVHFSKELSKELNAIMFKKLTPRERHVIVERFGLFDGDPKNLQSIGDGMGVTRERIRQIETLALKKLKTASLKTDLSDVLNT